MPQSDSASDFGSEVRTILEYIDAVASLIHFDLEKEIEDTTYRSIFSLIGELSEEALRRQELSLEAIDEIWRRDHDPASAPRKEGRV
jgi:hypothetical protein